MTHQTNPSPKPTSLGDILVVDDIPANLEFLSTVLTQKGYKVRSALSGQTAIQVAKAARQFLPLAGLSVGLPVVPVQH